MFAPGVAAPGTPSSSTPDGESFDSFLREAARSPAMAIDYVDPQGPLSATLSALSRLPIEVPPAFPQLPLVPREAYQIHGEYARGGMGRVLLAYDRRLGRRVAIKEILSLSGAAQRRFIHEAIITARLQHPGIVPIHEVGQWPDGIAFYAMKLVAGRSLSRLIRERPTLPQRVGLLSSVLAVADAMAYAHEQRIIHRDLKPANIVIGAFGETVLIDWGLALSLDDPGSDDLAGTPSYMAPEQARGAPASLRTDVYALGAILYHLLRGVPPYSGSTIQEVLDRLRQGAAAPLCRCRLPIPAELAAIVDKAMASDPAARYATAGGLAQDLSRFLQGQLVPTYSYSPLQLLARFVRRYRAVVLMGLLGLVLTGVTATLLSQRVLRERVRGDLERRAVQQALGLRARELARVPGQEVDALLSGVRAAAPALRRGAAPGGIETEGLLAAVAAGRRVLLLRGHDGPLRIADFTPDGAQAFTAGEDGTVRLWDARAGDLLRTLHVPGEPPRMARLGARGDDLLVAGPAALLVLDPFTGALRRRMPGRLPNAGSDVFSPDGALAVLRAEGSADLLRLWEVRSGRLVAQLALPMGPTQIGFSADSAWLLIGAMDGQARLYDTASGRLVQMLGAGRTVYRVALSPDGQRALTATDGDEAQLWDSASGDLRSVLRGHTETISAVRFSPDGGRALTVSRDQTCRLWDAQHGRLLAALQHDSNIKLAAFSPQGERVVTATTDGSLHLWDARSGQLLTTLRGHAGEVRSVAFSSDGSTLISAGADGTARLYNVRQEPRPAVLRTPSAREWLGFGAGRDGAVLIAGDMQGGLEAWQAGSGRLLARLRCHHTAVVRGAFSHDGGVLATRERTGAVCVWDLRRLELLRRIQVARGTPGCTVALDPAGGVVAVNADAEGLVFNSRSGALQQRLSGHGDAVSHIDLSPDGLFAATSSHDGTARLWWVGEGRLVAVLRGHGGIVNEVRFAPDGALLATTSDDHTLRTWDGQSGAPRSLLSGHDDEVWHLAFSPDGRRIASGSVDRTVRLWDSRSGRALAVLRGHEAPVDWPIFSPDGERLLSVAADRAMWLWDLREGRPIRALRGHTDRVIWAAFSPDGAEILSAGLDGTTRRWDGRTGAVTVPGDDGALLSPVGSDLLPPLPMAERGGFSEAIAALAWGCRLLRPQPEYASIGALCR